MPEARASPIANVKSCVKTLNLTTEFFMVLSYMMMFSALSQSTSHSAITTISKSFKFPSRSCKKNCSS